jgi:DNA gyrase/topoisomerase IV subunit A
LLKSLHKRQDSALSKYQNSSAELPTLLSSHAEEVRVWQTRCRALQCQNKELQSKIKQKDTIVLSITDQNKHLLQLNKDKNLEEREKLTERVKDLEHRLMDKDNDLKLMARRLQVDAKNHRTNLNIEQQKYRDLLSKIELSDLMLHRDISDKKSPKLPRQPNQRVKSPPRPPQSKSATSVPHENGHDKDLVTLILPPCEGKDTKKLEESIRTNSPRVIVNASAKLPTDNGNSTSTCSRVEHIESLKNGDDDDITIELVRRLSPPKFPPNSPHCTRSKRRNSRATTVSPTMI